MTKATTGGFISSVSDRERIEKIKARYPKGTRIMLDSIPMQKSLIKLSGHVTGFTNMERLSANPSRFLKES